MFAYVRYEGKHKAVLPTTLIKRFTPGDVDDFDHEKSKMVFWIDENGCQAGYYKAKVVMLGGKLMLAHNSSRRAPITKSTNVMPIVCTTWRRPSAAISDTDDSAKAPHASRPCRLMCL